MQFSFAFSGKLHRVSDFIAKFDQGTWNASAFHPPKTSDHCLTEALPELFELFTSRWQLIHYIRSRFVCQELFSRFSISSRRFRNFFWPPLLRSSLFSISNRNPFVKNFFHFFFNQAFRPAALADSLIIIRSPSPFVNSFFFFFRSFPPYPYPSFEPCRFTWYNVLKSHAHT